MCTQFWSGNLREVITIPSYRYRVLTGFIYLRIGTSFLEHDSEHSGSVNGREFMNSEVIVRLSSKRMLPELCP
jgi:hypothetical protein